ncbi:long-chain fatty acid--CoA ligase [Microbispora sp. NPDC046933]|uniref:long-chain-fatty-acid--CoA ligase n=1 Tax=Microbispora sp. NPDC046933 TaxID=3155618 RepID=UPI003403A37D
MHNLSSLLEDSAKRYPERDAIVFGNIRLSYAEVDALACQVANLLVERGVQPGDKVALSCSNLPQFAQIYFGILKAGATVVPLNVLLKAREVAYHLTDSEAKAYFCFEGTPDLPTGREGYAGFRQAGRCAHFVAITTDAVGLVLDADPGHPIERLDDALREQPTTFDTVATDEDDTAVILYTSGTTGQPKGAELRHRNMRDNALAAQALFGTDPDRPDTYLCVLPLFHSFGQTVIQNSAFAFGGTIVMLPRFAPHAALDAMTEQKVTVFAGVPTMYVALLEATREPVLAAEADPMAERAAPVAENLRLAISGGAALPVEVHRRFEERFGVTILEGYGLSETSPIASFARYGRPIRVGSIGIPIPGVEMKLLKQDSWDELDWTPDAVGEIAIKGDNVMKGYYKRPEATAEALRDGWFRSGDLARRDKDGWYYIVDRSKDMIIRGGYNVYPREIEEILMTHPAVSLAAVIGVPHDTHGEEVKAYVVLKPGSTLTAPELRDWSKAQLAAYKYPRIVEIIPSLPMTATGKILKRELS